MKGAAWSDRIRVHLNGGPPPARGRVHVSPGNSRPAALCTTTGNLADRRLVCYVVPQLCVVVGRHNGRGCDSGARGVSWTTMNIMFIKV